MTPEEFRSAGHLLVDWIADYRATIEDGTVKPDVKPGDIAARFEASAPRNPVDFNAVLDELTNVIEPGVFRTQHPMHFGWFPSNASLSSVLGDIASSGLAGLGLSWESCPSLTEVETVVVDWLRQETGLGETWHGTIHDTASTSCLVALLCARERASDHSQTRGGIQELEQRLRVYCTAQAHSSVNKAALLAGFGRDNLVVVAEDEAYAMDADALAHHIAADLSAGYVPAAIVATAGTTGTTAFDPLGAIGEIANDCGAWLHVDSAMAGSAMLLDEMRHLWDGLDRADSLTWNPHKWMGTILDTSLFYVQDPQHLIRVMSTNPSYLRSNVDGEVLQYRDWGIPLGRRFRSLKLLFQLRLEGIDAIAARLRRDLRNAQLFADMVRAAPGWRVVAPVQLQTVCVRFEPDWIVPQRLDEFTLAWANAVNASGQAYLTTSLLDGHWMVRVSIGAELTEIHHVEKLWAIMQAAVESIE